PGLSRTTGLRKWVKALGNPAWLATGSTHLESLAHFAERDAAGFERFFETLQRLVGLFAPEFEGLVVDRKHIARAGVIGHAYRLLRRAMRANPGLISADRHDGKFVRTMAAKRPEAVGHGGVAAENDSPAVPLEDVTIVAAVTVPAPARAPVLDFECLNGKRAMLRANHGVLAPSQFAGLFHGGADEKVGSSARGDRLGGGGQPPKSGHVQMVHVSVGEEHHVNGRQLPDTQGRSDQTLRSHGPDS